MSAIATVVSRRWATACPGSDLKDSAFLDRLPRPRGRRRVGHRCRERRRRRRGRGFDGDPAHEPRARRGPRARHPRAEPRGDPRRGRRDQARSRRGRHPRQDDDVVDARARPVGGRAATRRSSSAASSTRSAPTRRGRRRRLARRRGRRERRHVPRAARRSRDRHQRRARPPRPLRHLRRPAGRVRPLPRPGARATRRLRRRRVAAGLGAARPARSATAPTPAADYRMVDVTSRTRAAVQFDARRARRRARRPVSLPVPGSAQRRATPPARHGDGDRARRRLRGGRAGARRGIGGVARRFELRGERRRRHVRRRLRAPARARSPPRSTLRTRATGSRVVVRLPAAPLQPHRGALAGLRRRVRWAPTCSCSPTSTRPARHRVRGSPGKLIVNTVLDAHPTQRVAWLPHRSDVVDLPEVRAPAGRPLSHARGRRPDDLARRCSLELLDGALVS